MPFVDRSTETHPSRRLAIVIPAGLIVLTVIGMIGYALVAPVASHIG